MDDVVHAATVEMDLGVLYGFYNPMHQFGGMTNNNPIDLVASC